MFDKLLNWHLDAHPQYRQKNQPCSASITQLEGLALNILQPIEQQIGEVSITYGFTDHALMRFIQTHSSAETAPDIDQHASMELNSKGNRICKRDGASCDFYVLGFESNMDEVAKFIVQHLNFDRLYYYGKDKPIHISFGPDNSRYALIRLTRSDGLRVNKKSAKDAATRTLFDDL
ncbi:hypothetical protein L4C34_13305 [Vibrio profundum]|uniref:hypothetical protein n=1 Tax=Vibrio profundum TaxID=2910247 RepID=UPI003D0DE06B